MWRCETTSAPTWSSSLHSCRNRHCPKCQALPPRNARRREAELCALGYFHVVFTLPGPSPISPTRTGGHLRPVCQSLGRYRADDRSRSHHLGAPHRHHRFAPWGSTRPFPPTRTSHESCRAAASRATASAGCLAAQVPPPRAGSLTLFPGLFLAKLRAAPRRPPQVFLASTPTSITPERFKAYLAPGLAADRVELYAKPPFGGPEGFGSLYLSRYNPASPISNRRLISLHHNGAPSVQDYRGRGRALRQVMRSARTSSSFRFLIHVLPHGFHLIRTTTVGHSNRAAKIARRPRVARGASACKNPRRPNTNRRTRVPAASMSLLRWPHDHHRDLRARL